MKIFISERIIELVESNLSGKESEIKVVKYSQRETLENEFNEFEEEERYRKMIVICGDKEKEVIRNFFRMFKLVDAAGGLVRNEKDQYLLILRLGKWDLPKGKLMKGETTNEAAIREVKEETGIGSLKIIRQLPETYHIYTLKDKRILKRTTWYMMGTNSHQKLVPQVAEEITQVKWFEKKELEGIAGLMYASLREMTLRVAAL